MSMKIIDNPVVDSSQLRDLCGELASSSIIALDTEFTRIRTFRPKPELIQLASENLVFCVDMSECDDVTELLQLLKSSSAMFVMHSASQDLEVLKDLDAIPKRIFDTQIAAQLCGYTHVSYQSVIQQTIGIELSKSNKTSNWSKRPLTPQQVRYALEDARHLIPIQKILSKELADLGRTTWIEEECSRLLETYQKPRNEEDVWCSFRQAAVLSVADQHRVRELLIWREARASRLNRPRQWIISDADIMQIAEIRPKNEVQLSQIIGLRKSRHARWLREVVRILHSPVNSSAQRIWKKQKSLSDSQKKRFKEIMSIAGMVANQNQISTDLICTSKEGKAIVRGKRDGRIFSGWRRGVFADEIPAELLDGGSR